MARTAITPQTATSAGLAVTFEPANVEGNGFTPRAGRVLHVRNGSGAPITVTIPTPATVDGLAVTDRTYTVAAAGHHMISLGTPATVYLQTTGAAHVDYSSVTTVTVAVIDG